MHYSQRFYENDSVFCYFFLVVDRYSHLLLVNLFLFSHECNQIFSSYCHLLSLRGVWRRLWGIRVLLAFILIDTFLPPLRTPLSPAPAALLFPAKRRKLHMVTDRDNNIWLMKAHLKVHSWKSLLFKKKKKKMRPIKFIITFDLCCFFVFLIRLIVRGLTLVQTHHWVITLTIIYIYIIHKHWHFQANLSTTKTCCEFSTYYQIAGFNNVTKRNTG